MWCFIALASLSAVRKTERVSEWAEKNIKTVPHVFYDSAELYNWLDGNKNSFRTIEAQTVQNLKNKEPRPKFTGSYEEKKSA